ncbi:hypothetical protein GW17_00002153 [Ensete ventricosum]|nr:hypothetical protein GW17_00002153 [Ensete ventricosum]
MKRARGSSGRFLNTKQLQQQKQTQISAIPGCQDHSGSKLCSGSGFIGSSAPSINSDIRTASTNGSMLTQQDHLSFPFPDFHSNVGVGTQGGHTMMGDCHQNAYVSVVIILLEMVHSGTQKATSQRRPVPGISALPAISTARFATARTVSSSSRLSYSCYEGKDERREGG